MTDQTARLTWRETDRGDVPVSTAFDDPYFSLVGGRAETEHVFLAGNDLPNLFRDGFHIAELGFGTGLNFLTALAAWRAARVPGQLHFTSFEAFPLAPADLSRALAAHPDLPTETLTAAKGATHVVGADFTLTVLIGDARDVVPKWTGKADAWFLDGFSPAKNPELWETSLMQAVADHTAPGGSFATYTAAGFVRRALAESGFTVERWPGFGRKRHMTRGVLTARG
ncbi:MAG: tRNA (5-methylaminomethyl-2-thiouridine)(34)-methyltransferase MnmD [Loktanella sp.]|nr:tRNA (5-methylaminomethyl-2-thiouridine)(34)-methyltransferase MnmD [Loktanella sp.]